MDINSFQYNIDVDMSKVKTFAKQQFQGSQTVSLSLKW